jgi:hypothetical protein
MRKLLKTIVVRATVNIRERAALIIPIASLLILAISAVPVSAHVFTFTAARNHRRTPTTAELLGLLL